MAHAETANAAAHAAKPTTGEQVTNAIKFVADVGLFPGASQIGEGDVGRGLVYAGAGLLSRYLLPGALGPLGWIAIGIDSFSVSVAGKHIWEHGILPRVSVRLEDDRAEPARGGAHDRSKAEK
jgi:hypothetical protein